MSLTVREATGDDRAWVEASMHAHWGTTLIATRGRVVEAMELPALVCAEGDERLGLIVYEVAGAECEVVALYSPVPRRGAASALLRSVAAIARDRSCARMWLITTNDNLAALRFYQRWGMRLVAVHVGAMEVSRRLKPEIPEVGLDGIPLRDEIELELRL